MAKLLPFRGSEMVEINSRAKPYCASSKRGSLKKVPSCPPVVNLLEGLSQNRKYYHPFRIREGKAGAAAWIIWGPLTNYQVPSKLVLYSPRSSENEAGIDPRG
jgi:hypothetical protein